MSSTPGDGSALNLFFPASEDAAPATEAAPEPGRQANGGGECVLLVEDEDVLRRLAHSVLKRQGYAVLDARGPKEALELASAHPGRVDLILTDVMMPDMRGWEMAERLRDTQPQARVLYISGYVDGGETAGDRVRPLLSKPFKPRELLDEVRRILDHG